MPGSGHREAGGFEVWAARAWNIFNEGRPFSVLYPLLVLLAAAPLGLGPEGSFAVALCGALAMAGVLACFTFPLRGRALLWLALAATVPLLEPWRAPALLMGALGGWLLFKVVVWGSVYYHLRTGAPWLNGLRFWRLVLTNSDPTSGNALEQVPKMLMSLSAAALLAEEPGASSVAAIAAAGAVAALLGAVAASRFTRTPMPRYPTPTPRVPTGPPPPPRPAPRPPRLRDRHRRLQPRPPLAGAHARHRPPRPRGHRIPRRRAGLPGPHGRLLLVDAHRRHARRARHALELRGPTGRPRGVDLRRARAVRPPREARRDRAPARPVRRGRGALGHLGPANRADRSLAVRRGPPGDRRGGPRPARAPAPRGGPARARARRPQHRVPGAARRHRSPRRRLPRLPLRARQARRRHRRAHGRPRPGPGDRGPRPPRLGREPRAVRRLGRGRRARGQQPRAALGAGAGRDDRGAARRGAARRRPRPAAGSRRRPRPGGRARFRRSLPAPPAGPRRGGRHRRRDRGHPAKRLRHERRPARGGRRLARRPRPHRPRAWRPRDRPREPAWTGRGSAQRARAGAGRGLRRRRLPRRGRGVRPGRLRDRPRPDRPRARGLRDRLALPRGAPHGHDLASHAREPCHQRAARHAPAHGRQRRPDGLPRLLGTGARRRPHPPRLQLRAGAHAVAVGRRHPRRRGAGLVPPPHLRPFVRELSGVPGPRGAGRLARVAHLARDEGGERQADGAGQPVSPAAVGAEEREGVLERAERGIGPLGHERAARPAHVH